MSDRARVVVIGGGIAGLCMAWELARRDAAVTLVRSGRPRASEVAAGMLAPMPESSTTEPLLRLASEALHHYPAFLAMLAEDSPRDVGFRRSGVLRVARDEVQRVALRDEVGAYEAAGLPSQWLDARSVRKLAPGLADDVVGGLFSFDEAQVQPAWLLEALEATLKSRVAVVDGEVTAVTAGPDGVSVGLVGAEPLGADRAVVAAGSWSAELGGAAVPIRPVKGQLLAYREVPGPEPIVYSGHDYVVSKPDGSVLLGGTMEEAGFSLEPGPELESLRRHGARLWPALENAQSTARVGLRPAAPDGLPVCGPLPGMRAIYAFTGHFRNGFLLCPHGAFLAAQEVLDNAPQALLTPVRPARFHPAG